jgi:hypothetical protein
MSTTETKRSPQVFEDSAGRLADMRLWNGLAALEGEATRKPVRQPEGRPMMNLRKQSEAIGRWQWRRVANLQTVPRRPESQTRGHDERGELSSTTLALREWLEADSLDWDAVERARTEAWGS